MMPHYALQKLTKCIKIDKRIGLVAYLHPIKNIFPATLSTNASGGLLNLASSCYSMWNCGQKLSIKVMPITYLSRN
jgi:hypothetical protein